MTNNLNSSVPINFDRIKSMFQDYVNENPKNLSHIFFVQLKDDIPTYLCDLKFLDVDYDDVLRETMQNLVVSLLLFQEQTKSDVFQNIKLKTKNIGFILGSGLLLLFVFETSDEIENKDLIIIYLITLLNNFVSSKIKQGNFSNNIVSNLNLIIESLGLQDRIKLSQNRMFKFPPQLSEDKSRELSKQLTQSNFYIDQYKFFNLPTHVEMFNEILDSFDIDTSNLGIILFESNFASDILVEEVSASGTIDTDKLQQMIVEEQININTLLYKLNSNYSTLDVEKYKVIIIKLSENKFLYLLSENISLIHEVLEKIDDIVTIYKSLIPLNY